MIRLYSSLYPESDPRRHGEILECLERNLGCPVIDQVHVLLERLDESPISHPKLTTRSISHRPTYQDYFRWCNENGPAADDLSVVANSDICFGPDLGALSRLLRPDQCVALARWNRHDGCRPALFDRGDSQDSWIFRGPLAPIESDFAVGIPRCDNRILFELRQAGYEVLNPALSIQSWHMHGIARIEDAPGTADPIDPPYAYLDPHNLLNLPRTWIHNLRHPDARIAWRLDRRWIRSAPARLWARLVRCIGGAPPTRA